MAERLLIRVAFDGRRFHGTQRQPDVPTVNGSILQTLHEAGLLADRPRLRAQGRIDAGVSARDFPVAFDAGASLDTVANTLAGRVPAVIPFAGAEVGPGFDPRLAARSRTYRYHLPTRDTDPAALGAAWSRFEGVHDLSALARVDGRRGQDPVRRITQTRWWSTPAAGTVLEVRAPTFLRHQVRRMVGASLAVARGELSDEQLDAALSGGEVPNHAKRAAEPGGLVLHRVELGADWRPLPEAEAVASRRLDEREASLEQQLQVAKRLRPSGGSTPRRRRA